MNSATQTTLKAINAMRPLSLTQAEWLHDAVEDALVQAGLYVRREVFVPNRGDGRRGKLDLVAKNEEDGTECAIEIDRLSPRSKSLFKLRSFNGGRVVVLRERIWGTGPDVDDIDAVIGLA